MEYRTLGKTGMSVSEVGLGTWQLGSADWGVVDEKDALAILHRFVELGGNFIDTADVYGMGISERVIGKFLKETKETVYVATKLGRRGDGDNGPPQNFTLASARAHTQESMRNLGVDSIFLQQWHCIPTEEYRNGEVFEHLSALQQEGLIQNWGCSVESVEEGHLCLQHADCTALQVIYNIFRQKLNDELLPIAKEKNVGILARVPLASGLLAGKIRHDTTFPENDHRSYNAGGKMFNAGETFAGLTQEPGVEFADAVKQIIPLSDSATMAQLALRWILDNDAVTTVIPGASKLAQVESNTGASDLKPLSAEVHSRLLTLYRERISAKIIGKY